MKRSSAGSLATSRVFQSQRLARGECYRHVDRIIARVRELHPNDPAAQRRALERWSRVLRACDPGVAEALLDVPVTARRVA